MSKIQKTAKTISMLLLLVVFVGCKDTIVKEEMASATVEAELNAMKEATEMEKDTGAFLEITLKVNGENRPSAAGVYLKYKAPFLDQIEGATSKELIMRDEDVQVLHGFETTAQANAYLTTTLFSTDIVGELGPLLAATPEVRIYTVFKE